MDLTIDYNREFIHRIVGSVTGNGGTGTQLLEAGPVTISGTTDFASTRYLTSEVESHRCHTRQPGHQRHHGQRDD